MSRPIFHHRATIASLTRSRRPDDPELVAARRNYAAARLTEHIAATLATAPALTIEQADALTKMIYAATEKTAVAS